MENQNNQLVLLENDSELIPVENTDVKDNFAEKFNEIFDKYNITTTQREYLKIKALNPTMLYKDIALKVNRNSNYLTQFYNKWHVKNALREIALVIDNEVINSSVTEVKSMLIDRIKNLIVDKNTEEKSIVDLAKIFLQQTKETKQDINVTSKVELPY